MALRFNRGQHSTRSGSVSSARDANNSSAGTSKSGANPSKFVQKYLDECRSFYSCIYCRTHLANHDELISRSFQGNRSRAYLFNSVINVSCGPSVQRELNTGAHSVADIFCTNCGTTIGWKYEKAFVETQKYKEGKFIIELAHVVRENRHLQLDKRDIFLGLATAPPKQSSSSSAEAEAATIGTHHQGSLSPGSNAGQWSPGTNSSSSSSSSSNDDATMRLSCRYTASSGQNPHERRQPPRRLVDDEDDDDDEIDDDDVLMFPFYDDLFGNRSSYSSLSTSRSYQKRLRRSLHLEAAPYDWKYTHAGSSLSSSVSPTATGTSPSLHHHQQQQPQQQQQRPKLELSPNSSTYSSDSIEIPVNQASQAQSDNCSRHQLAVGRRFFASTSSAGEPSTSSSASSSPLETFPPQPTSASTLSTDGGSNRRDTSNDSELAPIRAPSSSSNGAKFVISENDDHGDTQFKFEHDKQSSAAMDTVESASCSHGQVASGSRNCDQLNGSTQLLGTRSEHTPSGGGGASAAPNAHGNAKRLDMSKPSSNVPMDADDDNRNIACGVQATPIDNNSEASSQSIPRTNSLSFDDEEFYDCNTDHDVSNSSLRPK